MNNQTQEFIGYRNIKRYDLRREDCLGNDGCGVTNRIEDLKKLKKYMEKQTHMKYYIFDKINGTIVDVDKPRRRKKRLIQNKPSVKQYGVNDCFL